MNTRGCIEFLEGKKVNLDEPYYEERNKKLNEVIKHLQMWEDLKSKYGTFFRDTEKGRCLGEMMAKMEYEYLLKEIRRSIEVRVLASNKEVINELEKEILDMNGQRFNKGKIRIENTAWKRD